MSSEQAMTKKSKAENLIQKLNVHNAKKVALLLVLSFIGYHGILHFNYGMSHTFILKIYP